MNLPVIANPAFVAWLDARPQDEKDAIDAYWGSTAEDERLRAGHRNVDYARLTYLIEYCKATYGYPG